MVNGDLQRDLREFMAWTRNELSAINTRITELTEHTIRQNGNIELVMERERDTRACAEGADEKASTALTLLSTLQGRVLVAEQVDELRAAHAKKTQAKVQSELDWLRDNIWKIALGGVTVLTLAQKLIEIFSVAP